jgi:hypothetical protein
MDKERQRMNEERTGGEDSLVYKYGVRDNVVKGLGIASVLGVIGFAAFKGYSRLKELEKIKEELELELSRK